MQRRIVSICLALVILVAILPLATINTFATTSNNIMYEMREENIEFRLSDGTLYYTNTISYPYFMGSSAAEIKINSKYAAIIERRRNNTTDFDALYQEALEWNPNGVNGLPFYDDVFAEVTYCDNGVISIKERSTMWSGGAHPYSEFLGYTYRISDGRELSLNEIITGTEKEIKAILDHHKQGIIDYRDAEAIMAAPFILTNKGLCFMCNIGDAVPRAEIVIPYSDPNTFVISAEGASGDSSVDAALQYFIENCDKRYLTQNDISGFDDEACLYARNAIYAKSGWIFSNQQLKDYFRKYNWYTPTVSANDFTEDMLNSYQVANRDLILAYQDGTVSEQKAPSDEGISDIWDINKWYMSNEQAEAYAQIIRDAERDFDTVNVYADQKAVYVTLVDIDGKTLLWIAGVAIINEEPWMPSDIAFESGSMQIIFEEIWEWDGSTAVEFDVVSKYGADVNLWTEGLEVFTYYGGTDVDGEAWSAFYSLDSGKICATPEWCHAWGWIYNYKLEGLNVAGKDKTGKAQAFFSSLISNNKWPPLPFDWDNITISREYATDMFYADVTGGHGYEAFYNSKATDGHYWSLDTDKALQCAAYIAKQDGSWQKAENAEDILSEYAAGDESAYEDYARTEWIKQHMEYAASDEFEHEIVRGFTGSLNDLFIEIRDDSTIKAYSTLDSVNQILSFDIDLSESQEYELLLAQIFFSYIGEDAIEEIYAENLTKAVIVLGEEVLKLDDFKQIGDSDQLKGILNALKSAKGAEEMNAACDSFFNFVDGYDNLDIKKHLADNIKKESFNLAWDVAIDSLDLVTTTLRELTMYVAVGEAYARTSNAFGEVLLTMRRNIGIPSDNSVFSPLPVKTVVTNDVIWRLIGNNNSPYPDPLNTPVVLKDLATAIEDFYTSIETYKNEDSTYIAQAAIADLQHGAVNDVLINNGANAAVSLFSCLPVVREYKIIKDILATGQSVIDVFTSVDDQEYLGTMLMRLYCVSYLHCLSVDSFAGTPESWNMASIDLDNYTPGSIFTATDEQDLYEYQFNRATKFDESINVYKSISVVAADYAMKYVDLFLADAISELEAYDEGGFLDRFLKNRDDLVRVVTQYKNSLKKLEDQKTEIQAIACHDADLQYDSETDEIIYNFKDSRIYIVACPVDVVVTTDTGDQIAYLSGEENEVTEGYEFYFHTIKATDDSGEYIKVAIVPDGYQIELKGTDDGTMHAFVADFTDGDVSEVETYFNIPIEKDSEGYFEVGADDANRTSLVMDQVTYSNMESAEDIPTDSGSNGVWIWIVAGVTVCGILVLVLLKKKSRK